MAVAWDSYRNGNYDVYARIYSAGAWGDEIPIAATARYEAYPSIAYDPSGRLWIAYEEGGRGWGKDFGAYDTTGIALYQGRLVKLRGLEPDGSLVAPRCFLWIQIGGRAQRARRTARGARRTRNRGPRPWHGLAPAPTMRAANFPADCEEHSAPLGRGWFGAHMAGLSLPPSHLVESHRNRMDRVPGVF